MWLLSAIKKKKKERKKEKHSLTLNTIRACLIRSVSYEHLYCTLSVSWSIYARFEKMYRCETNRTVPISKNLRYIKMEIFARSILITFFARFETI